MKNLGQWVRRLSRADIVFYTMPGLILLLLAGTVSQKYIGLYAAQKFFFASPIGYILLGAVAISLSLKFIFHSTWTLEKSGINLAHLGVLVLLVGGLLSAISAREGYMIIPEGQKSPYVYDYIKRELLISSDGAVESVAFEKLKPGTDVALPFGLKILSTCKNCTIETPENPDDGRLRGLAKNMALKEAPAALDPEENLSGVVFEVTGAGEAEDGVYIAFEGMSSAVEIKNHKLILGKQQRLLPFVVRLDGFEKLDYPGTDKARDYISNLTIEDGSVEWPVRIAMNEPLRYKGYTVYQSSFEQLPTGEITILSVVENHGRIFPYLGTAIVMVGLILHLWIVARGRAA